MLDELERLEKVATLAPWQEVAESGEWWIESEANGFPVCKTDNDVWHHQADIDVMLAARNALPALLRVARAAQAFEAASIDVDRAIVAGGASLNDAYHRERAARAELWVALADLEGEAP